MEIFKIIFSALLTLCFSEIFQGASGEKECYIPNNDLNSGLQQTLERTWMKLDRSLNGFQNYTYGTMSFQFNGDAFLIKFNDTYWHPGKITRNDGKESLALNVNDKEYPMHVLADDSNSNITVIYACSQDKEELVWILGSPTDAEVNWNEKEVLKNNSYILELLSNHTACSNETSQETSTTPESTTENKTTGSETTLIEEPTSDATTASVYQTTPTDDDQTTPPGETQPPSTTTEGHPTDGLHGFHIPNSNKTFYFLAQFQKL